MEQKIPMPVVLFKEKVNRKDYFVAYCPIVDISSQGKTEEEAKKNIVEALGLYFEQPEAKKIMYEEVGMHIVNISAGVKHAKAAHSLRA